MLMILYRLVRRERGNCLGFFIWNWDNDHSFERIGTVKAFRLPKASWVKFVRENTRRCWIW